MRAIVVRELGGPEAMVLGEQPDPVAGAGPGRRPGRGGRRQLHRHLPALRRLQAAGALRPGQRGRGHGRRRGGGRHEFSAGDHVAWSEGPGSYAERVAVAAAAGGPGARRHRPEGRGGRHAAGADRALPVPQHVPRHRGNVAVVHAAAGGVGLLLTQMIKDLGGTVIATTSSTAEGRARQAGGRRLRDDLRGVPRRRPRGDRRPGRRRGLRRRGQGHLRREPVGAPPARHDGPVRRVERPGARRSTCSGSTAAAPCSSPAPPSPTTSPTARSCCGAPATSSSGSPRASLHVRVGAEYPLADAPRAHEDLAGRRTTGKLILIP